MPAPVLLTRGARHLLHAARLPVWAATRNAASGAAPSTAAAIAEIPRERIRNFGIIAHIDHGKSTLSDRLMQACGVLPENAPDQFLDGLEVERRRGITIKAQTCSMVVRSQRDGKNYLMNLIDTPGHADFCYEVSRSLHACQGAVLLVDVSQGIQAQTVSTFQQAFHADLEVLCALNKCDLPHIDAHQKGEVKAAISELCGAPIDQVLEVSGKSGMGVAGLLEAIIERIPAPTGEPTSPFKALLFDMFYDIHKGVVLLAAVRNGEIKKGSKVFCSFSKRTHTVIECGILYPKLFQLERLGSGQVGFIVLGVKDIRSFRVGETIWADGAQKQPGSEDFPGFRPSRPMVYAGIFPEELGDGERLEVAMQRLLLTDASVESKRDVSAVLGSGFRCGFLGLLHLEVFKERLLSEYNVAVMATSPTVPYRVTYSNGTVEVLETAADFPTPPAAQPKSVEEPLVQATIVVPRTLVPAVQQLCYEKRGVQGAIEPLDNLGNKVLMTWTMPMAEVIVDFHSRLLSATHGYATFDYEPGDYQVVDLVKIVVVLNSEEVEALSFLALRDSATEVAGKYLAKLAQMIPPAQFEIGLQAKVGGKVVAKSKVKMIWRSNINADHSIAGDPNRKMMIANRQKEGKKKLREISNVRIPPEAFIAMVKL